MGGFRSYTICQSVQEYDELGVKMLLTFHFFPFGLAIVGSSYGYCGLVRIVDRFHAKY